MVPRVTAIETTYRKGESDMSQNSALRGRTLRIAAVAVTGVAALSTGATAQNVGVFIGPQNSGDFGGLAGADMICDAVGTSTFPGSGPWVAWLSVFPDKHAIDRIPVPGPRGAYVRASEPSVIIADNMLDLTDGSLDAAILLDHLGVAHHETETIWTGTAESGRASANSCQGWTSDAYVPRNSGDHGRSHHATAEWTLHGSTSCVVPLGVYCFGALASVPLLPLPAMIVMAVLLLAGGVYLHKRPQAVR